MFLHDSPTEVGLAPITPKKSNVTSNEDQLTTLEIIFKYIFSNGYIWTLCIASFLHYFVRAGIMDVRKFLGILLKFFFIFFYFFVFFFLFFYFFYINYLII